MIGVNDVTSELFSTADATVVETFARQQGLGMLSMWSIARDQPGPMGRVEATHSGTANASGSYGAIWGDYGSDPLISGGTSGGGGGGGGSGGGLPTSTINVAATSRDLTASDATAERFQLGYAWGRQLTIQGFNPSQDVLDLSNFWAEGRQARVVASGSGASVMLDFNAQQVHLPGVSPTALTSTGLPSPVLQVWQG